MSKSWKSHQTNSLDKFERRSLKLVSSQETKMSAISSFSVFTLFLLGSTLGSVEVIQNGNYVLDYTLLENDTLSVTATVRTVGWVGVGLSETGDMTLADLIIGGVRNGEPYIGDYTAFGNSRPIEDMENNILTYSVSENATHTTLSFTRLADTGDEMEDIPASRATHVIWAYGTTDSLASYHGNVNRGSIALTK